MRAVRCSAWLAVGALMVLVAACVRESAVTTRSTGTIETEPSSVVVPPEDGGDFRGFRWGDPIATVLAAEAKRSRRVGDLWEFATEVAGLPVTVGYGASSERFAAGWYVFASPAESMLCGAATAGAGSECSLKTAAYAMQTCARIAEQLDATYGSSSRPSVRDGVVLAPSSPEELDRELIAADSKMDTVPRDWSSGRVRAYETYVRPRSPGEGWRCQVRFHPSDAVAVQDGPVK